MSWKAILTFFVFFLATPLLLGQIPGEVPSAPGLATPSTPTVPAQSIVPSTIPAINATDLEGAGLNADSLDQSWGERAQQNQSDYQQGLPEEVPSSEIPSVDSAGAASDIAQELFPEEYSASQGELPNVPESTALPTAPTVPAQDLVPPTATPSSPSSPSF